MASAGDWNRAAGMAADMDIIKRVLDGDSASFELIMRRYNRRLYRIVSGVFLRLENLKGV